MAEWMTGTLIYFVLGVLFTAWMVIWDYRKDGETCTNLLQAVAILLWPVFIVGGGCMILSEVVLPKLGNWLVAQPAPAPKKPASEAKA